MMIAVRAAILFRVRIARESKEGGFGREWRYWNAESGVIETHGVRC
jgi:hypothetical protein